MNKLVEDLCAFLDMPQGLPAAYEIFDACHMHEIIKVSTFKYVAIHIYIGYIFNLLILSACTNFIYTYLCHCTSGYTYNNFMVLMAKINRGIYTLLHIIYHVALQV